MVSVTRNLKFFFEANTDDIFIYGAGNAGYWIGRYMNECGIDYGGYFDQNCSTMVASMNDHIVYPVDHLRSLKSVRIIISPNCYKEILSDLLIDNEKTGNTILCMVPLYKSIAYRQDVYNINILLGYFRRKLLKVKMPSIISNNCVAGHLYELFNAIPNTPTINTAIDAKDYVKFCENYDYYMQKDLEDVHIERRVYQDVGQIEEMPVGRLGDIKIAFAHTYNADDVVKKWNILKKVNKKDHLVFLYSDNNEYMPVEERERFLKLNNPHYIFYNRCAYSLNSQGRNEISLPAYVFNWGGRAIENEFDIVDWMNHVLD